MVDLNKQFQDQKKRFMTVLQKLDIQGKEKKLNRLQVKIAQPDFWQDNEKAQQVVRQISPLKTIVDQAKKLTAQIDQAISLLTIAQSKDEIFLKQEARKIEKALKKLEMNTYLSGPYDQNEAIISIHAGQGGTEAMDWTEMLFRMYTRYVEKMDWPWNLISESRGEEAGLKSVIFQVKAPSAYGYLRREAGTHRLVRQSPFNADSLRQTSFSLVEVLPVLDKVKDIVLDSKDLEIQFFRSSSQGGQNVQKVSTAVRLKHKPTGLVVESQSQRYQEQNRKIAEQLLKAKLWQKKEQERKGKIDKLKGSHQSASWGTQIRSYVLHPYKLVKDLRTNYEEKDPEAVLGGELGGFIKAELFLLP